MKAFLSRFSVPLTLAISMILCALTALLLPKLFDAWNVNEQTCALAPGWAQAIYWNAHSVTALSFLLPACIGLGISGKRGAFSLRQLAAFAAGAAAAALFMGILLLSGSLRLSAARAGMRFYERFLPELTAVCLFAFGALAFRKSAEGLKSRRIRLLISMLSQACILFFGFSPGIPAAVNGLLLGAVLFFAFDAQKSVLPEILFLAAFRLTESVVFSSPDKGGAYPVSEAWLTGGDSGLLASGLLALALIAVLISIATHSYRKRA